MVHTLAPQMLHTTMVRSTTPPIRISILENLRRSYATRMLGLDCKTNVWLSGGVVKDATGYDEEGSWIEVEWMVSLCRYAVRKLPAVN